MPPPANFPPPETIEANDTTAPLPHPALGSRTAECLFWLGRYIERAEVTARMLAIIDDVVLEEIPARERRRWVPLWQGLPEATGHATQRISVRQRPAAALAGDLTWRMTLDAHHPSSLYSSIDSTVFNARKLRDYVNPEAWGVLHRLCTRLESLRKQGERAKPVHAKAQTTAAVTAVLADANAFLGTAARTMLHVAGWQFLRMGIHLERATMTCTALRHVLGDKPASSKTPADAGTPTAGNDNPELSALLRMLGSQDAYRRVYQTRSQPRHVADFFLRQPAAPRSLWHNLVQIDEALHAVGAEAGDDSSVESAVAGMLRRLKELDLSAEFSTNPAAAKSLAEFLSSFLHDLGSFHPLLSEHYFSHQARVAQSATPQEAVVK